MLKTDEIPRRQWADFLERFSQQHQGWLATVEVLGNDLGAQVEARELSFTGVSVNSVTADAISVMLQTPSGDILDHSVPAPISVRLAGTGEGAHAALQIESADGVVTLVRFRSTIPAEMVDGFGPTD